MFLKLSLTGLAIRQPQFSFFQIHNHGGFGDGMLRLG